MSYQLGWIEHAKRNIAQKRAHVNAMAAMPTNVTFSGVRLMEPGPLVSFLDFWKHPRVIETLGFEFDGWHQLTGSCVGAGGGNVLFSLMCIEILRLQQREKLGLPFWLYTYGKSRELLGDRSEGEGSLGSTFAEAAKEYGTLNHSFPGLPQPKNSDGLLYDQRTELKWSNGVAAPADVVTEGKMHLVQTTAPCNDHSTVRLSIRGYFPVTLASGRFCNPGNERLMGTKEPVMVGDLDASGGHQTSIQAVYDHPELGPIFWNQNQWGKQTYKMCPFMKRRDGVWNLAKTVDWACKGDGEVITFSQFQGFPLGMLPWDQLIPTAD